MTNATGAGRRRSRFYAPPIAATAPLLAYVSTPLTAVDPLLRKEVAEVVALVKEVCARPELGLATYYPGDFTDPIEHPDVTPADVYRTDRAGVKGADALVVLAHVPSLGVGQELAIAFESTIPIVLVAPAGTRVSRMALGQPSAQVVIAYADAGELADELAGALRALRPGMERRRRELAALDEPAFGRRLRAHRERAGMSRDELAEAVGLTAEGVALLEDSPDRVADPSLTQLHRLASALAVAPGDLITPGQ